MIILFYLFTFSSLFGCELLFSQNHFELVRYESILANLSFNAPATKSRSFFGKNQYKYNFKFYIFF